MNVQNLFHEKSYLDIIELHIYAKFPTSKLKKTTVIHLLYIKTFKSTPKIILKLKNSNIGIGSVSALQTCFF